MSEPKPAPYRGIKKTLYQGLKTSSFAFWDGPVLEMTDGTLSCPGYVGNTYSKRTYDVLHIGSYKTPGIIHNIDVQKGREVDEKKGAGNDGARLTLHGMKPARVTIQILIWTPEQLRQLGNLWQRVFLTPDAGTVITAASFGPGVLAGVLAAPLAAYDVSHPTLDFHQIKAVVLVNGSGPAPGTTRGSRIFTIEAIEFLPAGKKNAVTTPVDAKGSLLDAPAYPTPGSNPANWAP